MDEYTKQQWRDETRDLNPEMTDDEFDLLWNEFVRLKELKDLH